MRVFYAVTLAVGLVALIGWIVASALAENVDSIRSPDRIFGAVGRSLVAAVAAFGLAGMSSSYAGWPTAATIAAAVAAAIAGAVLARS